MPFETRLKILCDAGILNACDSDKVREVVRYFDEQCGIKLTEENASAMITHLCAALGRISRNEPVEALDEGVYEDTKKEPVFPKAFEITEGLVRDVLPNLPQNEQKFLTMHIAVILSTAC